MHSPLIEVRALNYHYRVKKQRLHAVKDVSFDIYPGETLGLVGESGCGKTTVGKLLLNILTPTSGTILFRATTMQMVYQDPYSSLNPRMTLEEIIREPLTIASLGNSRERRQRVEELFLLVGLDPNFRWRYPHELSGGQRQRVAIARALAPNPTFLILDEPITLLDVSIQAEIINLLKKLQKELSLTYLFISHNLSIVKYLSKRVAVMYMGQIIEIAPSLNLYNHPLHPYTEALLSSIPIADPIKERERKKILIEGELPSPFSLIHGCPFRPRCPKSLPLCENSSPSPYQEGTHSVSCHLYK